MLAFVFTQIMSAWAICFIFGFYFALEAVNVDQLNAPHPLNRWRKMMFYTNSCKYSKSIDYRFKSSFLKLEHSFFASVNVEECSTTSFIYQLINSQYPFESEIYFFSYKLGHIPPLRKPKPAYKEFIAYSLWALSHLADHCREDVNRYIHSSLIINRSGRQRQRYLITKGEIHRFLLNLLQ